MKGILFKPDMIKAIVEGRKTVTRRLDGLKEINQNPDEWIYKELLPDGKFWFQHPQRDRFLYSNYKTDEGRDLLKHYALYNDYIKPRYHVGETVYIKEAWWEDSGDIYYKLDCPTIPTNMYFEKGKWKSPLFLPEIFARYFITITDVRPERLQDITFNDCRAEGSYMATDKDDEGGYVNLWDSINKNNQWSSNPYVWRVEFRKELKP